jgi:outer membrane protein assembly factor BamB
LGPGGNPVATQAELPVSFKVAKENDGQENIAWHTQLPGRSVSSPILVNDLVITTSSSAMEGRWISVTALDSHTGKIVWHRSVNSTGRPFCHATSANAAPTPCSDGTRIYAFFSSNDLLCYDLEGRLQWLRSLTEQHPLAGNDIGMSSSPVVVDGVCVVTVECQADSFTAGIDSATGATLWELPRPKEANWSSPRVIQGDDGKNLVIVQGSKNLVAIDPSTGRQAWQVEANCSTIASAVFAEGRLHVPAGGTKVYQLPVALAGPKFLWESSRINPSSSSLLVTSFGVLGLNRSVLVACDLEGNLYWQARLPDAGKFWATPVVAGDKLYAFAMDGKCFTVQLSQTGGEVIAESDLGAEVLGTPAVDSRGLYVRSVDGLWKITAN